MSKGGGVDRIAVIPFLPATVAAQNIEIDGVSGARQTVRLKSLLQRHSFAAGGSEQVSDRDGGGGKVRFDRGGIHDLERDGLGALRQAVLERDDGDDGRPTPIGNRDAAGERRIVAAGVGSAAEPEGTTTSPTVSVREIRNPPVLVPSKTKGSTAATDTRAAGRLSSTRRPGLRPLSGLSEGPNRPFVLSVDVSIQPKFDAGFAC